VTTQESLSPTTRWSSIVVIWVLAALSLVAIGLFSTVSEYNAWLGLALGGCVVVSLCVQIATQEKNGFVNRLAASVVGALIVLAIGAAILWAVAR
jgi:hypothetical protein